jgi:2-succinyl-6-hydroxy-2,4-cyclohexadiene-1-carboxylate synthase
MIFIEKIIKIDGLKIAVKIHGEGKPLFALHGFSESASTWDNLEIPGFQIFAIDLIGHGKSSKPAELSAYQLENLLIILDKLFSILANGQTFVLLGYSMGGRLAARYALAFPEAAILHLILESTGAGISDELERAKRRTSDAILAENILKNGAEWFADFWGNVALFDSQKKLPLKIQQEIWTRRAKNLPLALANTLAGTGQGELDYIGDKIEQIKPEILYLSGKLDLKYSQISEEIFAPCANVTCVSFENAGHNVHLETPELYNKIVLEYLEKKNVL